MIVDDLVTQGGRASTAMVLTWLGQCLEYSGFSMGVANVSYREHLRLRALRFCGGGAVVSTSMNKFSPWQKKFDRVTVSPAGLWEPDESILEQNGTYIFKIQSNQTPFGQVVSQDKWSISGHEQTSCCGGRPPHPPPPTSWHIKVCCNRYIPSNL